MLENIKTEIVYYDTQTDFELEFNICGCCNMRLLTSSENNADKLLSVMARAISRNKIVIITGNLTDDIVELIAAGIGYGTETVDTQELYHTDSPISKTISGSVPLITESAILGGCIVESGPQSLILLTSERNIQREIMKNLIEPYIRGIGELENDFDEETVEDVETDTTIDFKQFEEQNYVLKTEISNTPTETLEEKTDTFQYIIEDDFDNNTQADTKPNKKGFSIASLIIMILILLELCVLAYFLVVQPILNGIPLVDNFKNIFEFLQ